MEYTGETPKKVSQKEQEWNKFLAVASKDGKKFSYSPNAGVADLGFDNGTRIFVNEAFQPQMAEHTEAKRSINIEQESIRNQIEALKSKQGVLTEQTEAIAQIPILFDVPDFFEIGQHLQKLNSAGVSNILIAGNTYSISTLQKMVEEVSEYSRSIRSTDEWPNKTNEDIGKDLADKGITRSKISEFSTLGFRESMIACIRGDQRAILIKRGN